MGFEPEKISHKCVRFGLLVLLVFLNYTVVFADSIKENGLSIAKTLDRARELEDSDIHASIELLVQANESLKGTEKKYLKYEILQRLSIYQQQTGNLKTAIGYAYQALAVAEQMEDHQRIGETEKTIGQLFKNLKVFLKARNHFERAMIEFKQVKNLNEYFTCKSYVGHCLTDYGEEKKNSWYLDQAKKIYQSTLFEANTKKFDHFILSSNNNLSNLYLIYYQVRKDKKDLEISRKYALECIERSLAMKDTVSYAVGYSNYGEAYGLEGQIDSLKKYLDFARSIYIEKNMPDFLFSNCRLLIKSYLKNNRLGEAEKLLGEYRKYIDQFQFLAEYKNYYEYYSNLERLRGNYKAAYDYRIKYNKKI